jgi:hypothetical protein
MNLKDIAVNRSWHTAVLVLWCFMFCDSGQKLTEGPPLTYADFKIQSELAGWQEDSVDGYIEFLPDTLYDIINGGATPYVDMGLRRGFRQKMTGPEENTYQVFVMEYPTAKDCMDVYIYKKLNFTPIPIGAYPDSVAFANEVIEGIEGYARFDKFYFEVTVLGFDRTSGACDQATVFLDFYKSKM